MPTALEFRHILGLLTNEVFLCRLQRLDSRVELAALGETLLRTRSRDTARDWLLKGRALRSRLLNTFVVLEFRGGTYWLRLQSQAFEGIRESPDPVDFFIHGVLSLAGKHFGLARVYFDRWARAEPCLPWPFLLRGFAASQQGLLRQACRDYSTAIHLAPALGWAWALRGRSRLDLEDNAGMEDLDRAVALGPSAGWLYAWRAQARAEGGDTQGALEDFGRSLCGSWPFPAARLWRAEFWFRRQRAERARVEALLAVASVPRFQKSLYLISMLELSQGRIGSAQKRVAEAVVLDRRYVWQRSGTSICVANPHHGLPRELWALARSQGCSTRVLAWRGQTRMVQGDYQGAMEDLSLVLKREPGDGWARLWYADLARRLGRYEAALTQLSLLPPSFRSPWQRILQGACLLARGECSAAIEALSGAIRLDGLCGRGLPHLWRGEAFFLAGQRSQAVWDFQRALSFNPQWHWLEEGLERLAQGRDLLIENGPSFSGPPGGPDGDRDPRALKWRAACKLGTGDFWGAVEDLSKALEPGMNPWDAEAHRMRAQAKDALADPSAIEDRKRAEIILRLAGSSWEGVRVAAVPGHVDS